MRHFCLLIVVAWGCVAWAEDKAAPPSANPAEAKSEQEMRGYTEHIRGTDAKFDMVPIRGGEFLVGSSQNELGHREEESPQRRVQLAPFWMGKCEVTWNEFDVWMMRLDLKGRKDLKLNGSGQFAADGLTRPSMPYTDLSMGMGHDGCPVIGITQRAAKTYCEWLSAKTGHYYRLPTEAEWEYACRAGTKTAYSFGDDLSALGDYAWYTANSKEQYHPVGQKKANPWGLHDMHGNVAEWTLDEYLSDAYSRLPADKAAVKPVFSPSKLYPHSVRGGSWDDIPDRLRSASRAKSDPKWKQQDPQTPRSPWYQIDAITVGFRVVRPLVEDSAAEKLRYRGTGDLLEDR